MPTIISKAEWRRWHQAMKRGVISPLKWKQLTKGIEYANLPEMSSDMMTDGMEMGEDGDTFENPNDVVEVPEEEDDEEEMTITICLKKYGGATAKGLRGKPYGKRKSDAEAN